MTFNELEWLAGMILIVMLIGLVSFWLAEVTKDDKLILKMLPEKFHLEKDNLYERLLHICHFVSLLTDGNALELYKTINGTKQV